MLGRTLQARLTLLSAPPGFGKTTALIDWLSTSGPRHAWITLDEADNDPVRFLRYLTAAVGRLSGSPVGMDAAPRAEPLDVTAELAAVLGECAEPTVLVLDDYHVIDSRGVQAAVGHLLERLPPQAHLVLSTRVDPALPLARLRARGELLEIRADALRFSVDEARAFFAERTSLDLAEADVATLVERTEGWPAVLQLAALSLASRPDVSARVRDFAATHRYVLDYVVEEVLAGLPGDMQRFLLETSILGQLCAPLCDAVTGGSDGQARLEEIERANLLIVPLDDERRWYRYHGLFAEILRARLAAAEPSPAADLHARASAWYEEQGDDDRAIAHAFRSGDVDRMSRLVAIASGRHLSAGELSTVLGWLDALPPDVLHNHAQLSASYAWCLLLLQRREGVAAWLADADRALAEGRDGGPEMRIGIPPQLALLRSQLAGLEGDGETAVAQARLARDLVPPGIPVEAVATLRGTASDMLGLALLRAGDLDGAAEAYEEALPDLRAGHNAFALGRTIYDLTKIGIERGDAAGALQRAETELARAEADGWGAASGAIWAAMARAAIELGRVELAETAARRAVELATRSGDALIANAARGVLGAAAARDEAATRREGMAAGAGHGAGTTGSDERVSGPEGRLIEPLTGRELEVLRLVAVGRSNSQIAAELFVTVGTVKSHLHTISGKLGAANRVEAVARGREVGLLR